MNNSHSRSNKKMSLSGSILKYKVSADPKTRWKLEDKDINLSLNSNRKSSSRIELRGKKLINNS